MHEQWYLGCDHDGPDGLHTYGAWFPDHERVIAALTYEMGVGYYTKFTICQGSPALLGGKRALAAGAWYPAPGQAPA